MAPKHSSHAKKYHVHLSRQRFPIPCPYESCGQSVLVCYFERHCCDHHSMNSKLQCVWCHGQVSWAEGTKCKHMDHLQLCLRQFIYQRRTISAASESEIPSIELNFAHTYSTYPCRLLNLIPMDPAKNYFHHAHNHLSDFPHVMDSFFELPFNSFILQDDTLNLAISYVQTYLKTQKSHDWFHAYVKVIAFESFANAMKNDKGMTQMLEFSCLCDAGEYTDDRYRQHRHMILVSEKGHLQKNVWPKVQMAKKDKLYPKFPCKYYDTIVSPLHLVNTLGYVSQRKSRGKCFSKEGPLNDNHFYIFKSLPAEYKLPLVMQWDTGLSEFLYEEKFKNISVPRIANSSLMFLDSKWKQKIKDFYDIEHGIALPVEKGYLPTHNITSHFFYLLGGKKLYFEYSPENELLDDASWLRKQIEGGNCFYDVVSEDLWTPRPADQSKLNDLMPLVNENATLKSDKEDLKRKCEALEKENSRLKKERGT